MKCLITKSLIFRLGVLGGLAFLPFLSPPPAIAAEGTFAVALQRIEDRKAVFATVESADTQAARARIGGTVADLSVDEGDPVTDGQLIATIGDPKLLLTLKSLEARLQSLRAERTQVADDLARAEQLFRQGVIPRTRLDQARTAMQVIDRNLAAQSAERQVVVQQEKEGAVLSPGKGRVIAVLVTDGAVILAGEPVATIATGGYLLRMEVPERHARFIAEGDTILVGTRGLDAAAAGEDTRPGTIVKVYPRISNGRVVADIAVADLGGYFVGERAIVYVKTGEREAFVVPGDYLTTRFGVTYARLEDGSDVVVQPGRATDGGIEVLSGLRAGDVLLPPEGVGQ